VSLATLADRTVTGCRVHIPAWGVWWAEVELASTDTLSGSVTLVLADASFVGTVMNGGAHQGRSRWIVAGGAGGWGKTIAADSESNDAGAKLKNVIRKAATLAGESFNESSATGTIGSRYARPEGPASRSLALLAPKNWYVDTAGVTQIGQRTAAAFEGAYTLEDDDAAAGRLVVAAPQIADLLPGAILEGITAVDVQHDLVDDALRTTIWGATRATTDRMSEAFQRIIQAVDPWYLYRGQFEYRIVSQEGDLLNLQIVRASSGLPDLSRVRIRPGVPGMTAMYTLGSRCIVMFVDADPTRPSVVSFEHPDAPGFQPDVLNLGPAPREKAVRTSDTIQCGPWGGKALTGSAEVKIGGVPSV